MSKLCDYCGEYRPCMKEYYFPAGSFFIFLFNWICKDCAMAKQIECDKHKREMFKKKAMEQKVWRIKRDKILTNEKTKR